MPLPRAGDIILTVDIASSGQFATAGVLREPPAALAFALQDLQNSLGDTGMRDVLVHALATQVAGRCIPEDRVGALEALFEKRIAVDWRIAFPGVGVLQALFLVTSLESREEEAERFDLILQLAGRPEFHIHQPCREEIA